MLTIVYRSEAIDRLPYSALADICLFSARSNCERGITGFLVELDGIFLQVLEGDPDRVDRLFARIVDDPRHRNVTLLRRETSDGPPEFGFWAMNFGPLDTPTFWQAIFGTPMRSEEFRQRSQGVGFARDVLGRAYMHACIVADVDPAAHDMVRGNIPALAPI
ncbi:BLUF domain-containing protein [Azospirillum sp. YIM B02556]|uniref:BLUF domain-containing protein n=1 Tax=Azospirillum endophyticum TaxID=2800326 RepID=A0ABS1EZ41_9PROT|nr:BLUF domain-containing protein [Azospirillum endophyticum]MBK1836398.1 BLUF domain-containing protein [Azospirillum endophyticum]